MSDSLRFQLFVDEGGEWLVASAPRLVLGHARDRSVDLPILGDLLDQHAYLTFGGETFHSGPGWCVEPSAELAASGRTLEVDGQPVRVRRVLSNGERLTLSRHVQMRYRLPDPASATAALELERGQEILGAQRVLLFVPGPAGRLRIAGSSRAAVRVPRLEAEITLTLSPEGLDLASTKPLSERDGPARGVWRIAFPFDRERAFTLSRAASAEPPFGLTLKPVLGGA